MIPIIYDKTETAFVSNGLGRLRDVITAVVTEERNGVYELDFQYPVNGANYDLIQVGRIVGVTHDETGDVQPFDIVSYKKPIDGVVEFHCVHISYRQAYYTATGSGINSLADAFTLFGNATPANPFTYTTDKTSTGYMACADGTPRTVRQMLGGIEGSVLDAYGGEYEFDKWNVILHSTRGQMRGFTIRYGVNMLEYDEEVDSSNCFSSVIPYWTDGTTTVVGDKQTNSGVTPSGREQCVPLDVSDKFEVSGTAPTKAQVNSTGASVMNSKNPTLPTQTIDISFVRLQDAGENDIYETLLQCRLCDTINVVFPDYESTGQFKIVKTVWNVLKGKYDSMELGALSVTLAQALGITTTVDRGGGGGVSDYNELSNRPQINGVTLTGDKSASQLSIHDVPAGGSAGQVLTKQSATNYDLIWQTPTIPYCTCATAAATAAKTTTIVRGTFAEADLIAGAQVLVKFTNSNTVASPTLKIGDTTAKAIRRYGSTAPSTSAASSWNAGEIVLFVYDGTYWYIEGWINTTYSSMTEAEITAGTGTTARLITPARLKLAIDTWSGGGGTSTSVPTADTIAEFDGSAHMNSTDMDSQGISDFIDGLNVSGAGNQVQTRKLLWTNTTATASFAAQTVSLDLSYYDYVEVWLFQGATADALLPNPLMIPIGEFRNIILLHSINAAGTNENTGARLVTVSSSGVTFGNYAYKNRRSGGTQTTSNNFAIPQWIYGVKYL